MPMGRPKTELALSEDERSQLTSSPFAFDFGGARDECADPYWQRQLGSPTAPSPSVCNSRVLRWASGVSGSWSIASTGYDEVPPGKPRTVGDERLAQLIHKPPLHTKPAAGSTHWSVRRITAETAISPTSVHCYFKLLGLQPHRSASFTLSTDQFFIEKLRDVVGLYLSPPEHALACAWTKRASVRHSNAPNP